MDVAERLLDRLEGHARENARHFSTDPAALREFMGALDAGRFRYALDRFTCDGNDCFRSWAELRKRGGAAGPYWADCADLVGAIAGAALTRGEAVAVGVIPRPKVSHAVLGIPAPDGFGVGDPSVWFGMPHMRASDYEDARFRRL